MTLKDIKVVSEDTEAAPVASKVALKISCKLTPESDACIASRNSGKHGNCPGLVDKSCKSNNIRGGNRGQAALAKANAALQN